MYILHYICFAINLSVDTLATSIFSWFVWFFSEYTARNLVCKYPLKSLFVLGATYSEVELEDQKQFCASYLGEPLPCFLRWIYHLHPWQWWRKLARCRVLCLLMCNFLFCFAFYIRYFSKYEMTSHCDFLCLVCVCVFTCACMCAHMCAEARSWFQMTSTTPPYVFNCIHSFIYIHSSCVCPCVHICSIACM